MKNEQFSSVLHVLRTANKPLALSQVMGLLGAGFAERTVRRWLHQLRDQNLIEITGNKRSTRYSIKSELAAENSLFSEESQQILGYIKQPLFMRQPVEYDMNWLSQYIPNQTFYFQPAQLAELQQLGQRGLDGDAGTYARKIYNRLLIDLSYNSSRLEGNTYSLLDTERLILQGDQASGKLNEEAVMILNHKEAIRYLVDNAARMQINTTELFTLHYLLADGLVAKQYAGHIRDHGVRISSSTYIPLENPEKIQELLNSICSTARKISNPFECSAFLLIQIAYLQAFHDVNKRTSRLAANIPLIAHNLVPLSFNAIGKEDYLSAMLVLYERLATEPLLDLFMQSYRYTAHAYDATAETVGIDTLRVQYRQIWRDIVKKIILQLAKGESAQQLVEQEVRLSVPTRDQDAIIKQILEDLDHLGPQHIAGMGITRKEFEIWLAK